MSRSYRKNPCLSQRSRSGAGFKQEANQKFRRVCAALLNQVAHLGDECEELCLPRTLKDVSERYDLYDWPTRMALGRFIAQRRNKGLTRRDLALALSK